MSLRVGNGYDSHRLVAGRRLVLGGVEIASELGLDGHSDADVVAHALIDALLGAAGLGDIGTHFPPTDERWRDADSIELLRSVRAMIAGRVLNADLTVIAERPRLGPHREEIAARLSETLGAPVSVKATTNESMGWIGRGEGVACIATTLLDLD